LFPAAQPGDRTHPESEVCAAQAVTATQAMVEEGVVIESYQPTVADTLVLDARARSILLKLLLEIRELLFQVRNFVLKGGDFIL
jgi:hypothetical protein